MRALKRVARPRAKKAPLARQVTALPLELGPVGRLAVTLIREGYELVRAIGGIPHVARCPFCGAIEVPSRTPRTVYACGSSEYDGRPGSFARVCRARGRSRG
jgi:hypothetical protein